MKADSFTKEKTLIIKGVAILMMMIHHCYLSKERYEGYYVNFWPISETTAIKVASYFKICVAIFVFLTGYGLTIAVSKQMKSMKQIGIGSVRRWVKLWCNYIVIFVLFHVVGLVNTFFHLSSVTWDFKEAYGGVNAKSIIYFLTDAAGLSDLFQSPSFNGTWWYMSLASILIFLVPLMVWLYERYGIAIVLLSGLLPRYLGLTGTSLGRYFLTAMVGIWMAEEDIPYRIKKFISNTKTKKIFTFIILLAAIFCIIYLRNFISGSFCSQYVEYFDCFSAVLFVFMTYIYISDIPVVREVLLLLGKHSMNIFLLHTFYRAYYLKNLIYYFKFAMINVIVLLGISLLTSILLEKVKDVIKFYPNVQKLVERIN